MTPLPITLLALGLFLAAGCDARPERIRVEGRLLVDGRPLADVLVTFLPDPDSGGAPARASGHTDADGYFRLQTEDQSPGVPAGAFRVVIEDLAIYKIPRSPDGTLLHRPAERFPSRFGDALRTPLRRRVERDTQTIEIDLAKDG